MEIIEGIHRVNDEAIAAIDYPNVYIVINGEELAVIDTGLPGNAKKIIRYIQKIGHHPTDIKTIILTHFHMDHAGCAKELKDLTNAKVAVHVEDADYVSGKEPLPEPKSILLTAALSYPKTAPAQVDVILMDGDKIAGLTVIHTPGHTPGSIMLLDEKRKALFTGDSLILYDGKRVGGAPELLNANLNQWRESIAKVSTLNFDIMLPGHGEPFKPNASEEVKKFSETLKQK